MSTRKNPEDLLRSRTLSATDQAWARYQAAAVTAKIPFAEWMRQSLDNAAIHEEKRQTRKAAKR
jgi:hypothetical protein